jgi:transposase
MLITETHFTTKSHINIPNYTIYDTKHPDGTAHGGSAVIVNNKIKHYATEKYSYEHLQAASIVIEDYQGSMTISAIYCPPKHKNKKTEFDHFFKTLGNKFIAGGDFNAKNTQWGSRTTTTKGRELLATIRSNNLNYTSTGQPTYWPTDPQKIPDLLDFYITKGFNTKHIKTESCLDLFHDHSAVVATIYIDIVKKEKQPSLYTKNTNWSLFKEKLDILIDLNIPLKTTTQVEDAVQKLTQVIQEAAWQATPDRGVTHIKENIASSVKENIANKRKLREQWRRERTPENKRKLNKATKDLKNLLHKINYLSKLSPTEDSDYALWKATKKLKRPQQIIPPIKDLDGKWCRNDQEKADAFAEYLSTVFTPHQDEDNTEEQEEILEYLGSPFQMDLPIQKFTLKEVKRVIMQKTNPTKAPGYDLITGKVLKETTKKCQKLILLIFNAVLRLEYFPEQWKVAQIILLLKPGKNSNDITSYRPISLLPLLSKVLEKLLINRLQPIIEERKLIPKHQFGFRNRHSTIEQVHRIVNQINKDLECKRYCSAAFLDISQAFDKVWHDGLCYKLKKNLPHHPYQILKSYLTNRRYLVKQQDHYTNLYGISAGVPQGSVLGPLLYLLYTADLPTTRVTTVATFADDTAILASHINPVSASRNLQTNLDKTCKWLKTWKIKANETKSTHVTFTLRKDTCPPVNLNNKPLPQTEDVKYLGLQLERRMTWKKHIFMKRKQLGLKFRQLYWLIGRKSQLSLENKILIYKAILKPVWTYGIQLWGTASQSNIEILQRFQNKVLRTMVDAPWYVPNFIIQQDLKVPSIRDEIKNFCIKYLRRFEIHPNELANKLTNNYGDFRRLKRFKPADLSARLN